MKGAALAAALTLALTAPAVVALEVPCKGLAPWKPNLERQNIPEPESTRPPKGMPMADPFGTCILRATNHAAETKDFARNDYARRQAFNADETRFLIIDNRGAWHVYETGSLKPLGALQHLSGDAEPHWHPKNPKLLYYLPRNGIGMKLHEINVDDNTTRVAADFGARVAKIWPGAVAVWTRSEGSPSMDGRYWAFQVEDKKSQAFGFFTYDLQTDTILGTYDFAEHKKGRPDHVTMSPSGRFAVVGWEYPEVFERDLKQGRKLGPHFEHSDIGIDANGDDTYVSIDYKSGGMVFMQNLATGKRTDFFRSYLHGTATAMHFSAKSYNKPGWFVLSTSGEYDSRNAGKRLSSAENGYQWLHRRIFAVEMHPDPRVINLAYTHITSNGYWTEPHASVNRDFTRVIFNSNWGTSSKTDVDTFFVLLPAELPAARKPPK
jgi:hypothetical protein